MSCYAMGSCIHAIMPWVIGFMAKGGKAQGDNVCLFICIVVVKVEITHHRDISRGMLISNVLCDHNVVMNSSLGPL